MKTTEIKVDNITVKWEGYLLNSTIILASGSPRRRELLTMAGIPFQVIVSETDETLERGISPEQAVLELSQRKAQAVGRMPGSAGKTVVAADTMVALGGEIFGKPRNREDAAQILHKLSGRTHQVYTGVCILSPRENVNTFYERTDVEFYPLAEKEIAAYIDTGEPMDKAGAYGIQGKGALLVKRICGDYYNVMGLPISRLTRLLKMADSE